MRTLRNFVVCTKCLKGFCFYLFVWLFLDELPCSMGCTLDKDSDAAEFKRAERLQAAQEGLLGEHLTQQILSRGQKEQRRGPSFTHIVK